MLLRENLAVVVIGKPLPLFRPQARKDTISKNINVLVCPTSIYVSMQTTKGPKAPLPHHLPGRGTQKPPAFPEEPKKQQGYKEHSHDNEKYGPQHFISSPFPFTYLPDIGESFLLIIRCVAHELRARLCLQYQFISTDDFPRCLGDFGNV